MGHSDFTLTKIEISVNTHVNIQFVRRSRLYYSSFCIIATALSYYLISILFLFFRFSRKCSIQTWKKSLKMSFHPTYSRYAQGVLFFVFHTYYLHSIEFFHVMSACVHVYITHHLFYRFLVFTLLCLQQSSESTTKSSNDPELGKSYSLIFRLRHLMYINSYI